MIRRAITLGLVAGAFWSGMQVERLLQINRHIDLCVDDTSAYYREHGRFHPDCEGPLDVFP